MVVSSNHIPRKKGIFVRLTDEEFKRLRKEARDRKIATGSFMRMAVFDYLKRGAEHQ